MKRNFFILLLSISITACVAAPQPQATLVQISIPTVTDIQASPPPTQTPVPTATPEPTTTATEAIPMIQVGELLVPDPSVTNPELFSNVDIKNIEPSKRSKYASPISYFVNAMQMVGIDVTAEQVTAEITFQEIKDKDGNSFVVAIYSLDPDPNQIGETLEGPIPLLIREEREGKREWREITIRELADKAELKIGAHLTPFYARDPQHTRLFLNQFNTVLTGALNMQMETDSLRPDINTYNFSRADKIIDFGSTNELYIEAHHLIWGNLDFLPSWLKEGNFTRSDLEQIFVDHITGILRHYEGKVDVWSVVNEPQWSFWEDRLGRGYLENAFRLANQLDPSAQLILNNVRNETAQAKNGNSTYALVETLIEKGVPIHGVGFQMHLDGVSPPEQEEVINQILRYKELGIKVFYTEFDVDMSNVKGTESQRKLIKAKIYSDMIDAALITDNCDSITFFGFTNKVSMYTETEADPLPFDTDYNPDASYFAILHALLKEIEAHQ